MSQHNRANATFSNYAISLGIIVAIVLAMAFVVSIRSQERIPTVDYAYDAAGAEEAADYTTYVPGGLSDEWVPTSSTLDASGPVEWSLGFATPRDSHAMLSMSDGDPEEVISERTREGRAQGEVALGDRTWERYARQDPAWRGLVLREDGATVIVAGSAQFDELEHLAASLEPQDEAS